MDWTMQGGSPLLSYLVEADIHLPLQLAWKTPVGVKAPPVSDVLILGNCLLVKTYTMVSSLDLATGELLWRTECLPIKVATQNFIRSEIGAWGERLFFGDYYGNLYCIDIRDGHTLWIKEDAGPRGVAMCVTEDRIICATDATTTPATRPGFHVLDLDGNVIWAKKNTRFSTNGVSVYKDWIIYGERPGLLTVARLSDGVAEHPLNLLDLALVEDSNQAHFFGTPTIVGDHLMVNVGVPWRILVFDLQQRQLKWWYYNVGMAGWGMNYNSVYSAGKDGDFWRFDLHTGQEKLQTAGFFPQGEKSSAEGRGTTVGNYFFINYPQQELIFAFDIRTGKPVWEYHLQDMPGSPVSYAQGNLVFCDAQGLVHCFRIKQGDMK